MCKTEQKKLISEKVEKLLVEFLGDSVVNLKAYRTIQSRYALAHLPKKNFSKRF